MYTQVATLNPAMQPIPRQVIPTNGYYMNPPANHNIISPYNNGHQLMKSYSTTTHGERSTYGGELPPAAPHTSTYPQNSSQGELMNNNSFNTNWTGFQRTASPSSSSYTRYPRNLYSLGSQPPYYNGESTLRGDNGGMSISSTGERSCGRPPLPPRRTPLIRSVPSETASGQGNSQEMEKLQSEFAVLSKGGPYIDRQTFMTLLEATLSSRGSSDNPAMLNSIFNSMDYKNDGVIDFDEFVAAYRKLRTSTDETDGQRVNDVPSYTRSSISGSKYSLYNPYSTNGSGTEGFQTTSTNRFIPEYQDNRGIMQSSTLGGGSSIGGGSYSIVSSQRL